MQSTAVLFPEGLSCKTAVLLSRCAWPARLNGAASDTGQTGDLYTARLETLIAVGAIQAGSEIATTAQLLETNLYRTITDNSLKAYPMYSTANSYSFRNSVKTACPSSSQPGKLK